MSASERSGYRTVHAGLDRMRWQRLLFDHIRKASRYRDAVARGDTASAIATMFGLTQAGQPCAWAVDLIEQDLAGTYRPDTAPRALARSHGRVVELRIGPDGAAVKTFSPTGYPRDPVRTETVSLETPGQYGAADWQAFEAQAVAATRAAIRDLHDRVEQGHDTSGWHSGRRVKAADEHNRKLQIERLALRLSGRAGIRNDPRTDRRWCETLGIDSPSKTGKS